MADRSRSRPRPLAEAVARPGAAVALAVGSAVLAGAGAWFVLVNRPPGFAPFELASLELSGNHEDIARAAGRAAAYRSALTRDLWFIGAFTVAIYLLAYLGRQLFVTLWGRAAARGAMFCAVLAGLLSMAANRVVFAAIGRLERAEPDGLVGLAQTAQACALVAAVLLAFAVAVAVSCLGTVLFRWMNYVVLRRCPIVADAHVLGGAAKAPARGRDYWASNWATPRERCGDDEIGICVSGGGIRSATFALGALQVLQENDELLKTRYLVAVSGGAYAAGAMRLALQPNRDAAKPNPATAKDVFGPGSPEFHHLRRHGKYLADGAGEWMRGLGAVLGGLLIAQVTLLATAVVAGLVVGRLYAGVPALTASLPHPWLPHAGVGWAMAAPFIAATTVWLIAVVTENAAVGWWGATLLLRLARALFCVTVAVVVVALVIPLLVYASDWLTDAIPRTGDRESTTAAAAGTVITTGYVATIIAILTAVRRVASPVVGWAARNRARLAALPSFLVHRLLTFVGAAVLVVAHLYVFARVVADNAGRGEPNLPRLLQEPIFLIPAGLLVALTLLADQTRWSLHPFYRRRLASAFAVRRVQDGEGTRAEAYDFGEPTDLASHCSTVDGFPQVIFVTAANLSGQDLAPPGRRAIPYTLSGDWIGSPRLGWIATAWLGGASSKVLKADLTTQAAMAMSGAAFASAMGAASKPYALLFTLTNARLGSWLPNPAYLYGHRATLPKPLADHRWHRPWLPRWRTVSYLLREIFGVYRADRRLLLLTDGGHYDNLGLVELLRHAPSVVYCIDGSAGASVGVSALGPAISLARQDLGVKITFVGCPEDADAVEWADKELGRGGVLVCTIDYSDCPVEGLPDKGTLYLARAVVAPDAPWEVQAYQRRHSAFPNDATSDQWFGQEQFDAYHALGRYAGEAALARRRRQEQGDVAVPSTVAVPPMHPTPQPRPPDGALMTAPDLAAPARPDPEQVEGGGQAT